MERQFEYSFRLNFFKSLESGYCGIRNSLQLPRRKVMYPVNPFQLVNGVSLKQFRFSDVCCVLRSSEHV